MGGSFNGELAYVFVVSILDAAILSWIALRWYRRSVSRIMQRPAGFVHPPPLDEPLPSASIVSGTAVDPLKMAVFDASQLPGTSVALPAGVSRRLTIAYIVGVCCYSVIMTAAMCIVMWPLSIAGIAAQVWANAWPLLPALIALLLLDWKRGLALLGAFVAFGALFVPIVGLTSQMLRSAAITSPFSNAFWAIALLVQFTYVPLVLIALSGWRRIRALMAPALAATLLFGFGLFVFRRVITYSFDTAALRTVILDAAVLTSSHVSYYGIFMLLSLPVGWLVWRALIGLASAYRQHRFSDIQLIVDCWILIVAAETTTTHLAAPFGLGGVAIGVAAFAAYRAGVALALRALPLPELPEDTRERNRLLLLRVFGYQARTESLFDHIAQRWRFRGPVQLIAGTDLALRMVDPGDVLAFISGRLRDQYVSSVDEVPTRVARVDMDRDPDGRFRINEVYCLENTWQQTLQALLGITDIIVMDLRGFTKDRKGAQFELREMVGRIPADRIVLISDRTTDEPLVESILRAAHAGADGRVRQNGNLALVRVEHNSRRELDGVMSRLTPSLG